MKGTDSKQQTVNFASQKTASESNDLQNKDDFCLERKVMSVNEDCFEAMSSGQDHAPTSLTSIYWFQAAMFAAWLLRDL